MASKKKSTTNIYRDRYPSSSRYLAVNDSERNGLHPAAEVDMDHGYYEYSDSNYNVNDKSLDGYYDEGTDQMRLFNMRPAKVTYAISDHTLRSRVPTLLGMAVNDAKDDGFGLTYDDYLSPHSSRLAKRGMEQGILTRNTQNPSIDDDGYREDLDTHEYTIDRRTLFNARPADPDTVSRGKKTIHSLVRRTGAGNLSTQFNHPDLGQTWHQPELGQ